MATIANITVTINLITVPVFEWMKLMEGLVQSTCPITQSNTVNIPLFGDINLTLEGDIFGNTVKIKYLDRDDVTCGIILSMSNATGELTAYQFFDVFSEDGIRDDYNIIPIDITNDNTDDTLTMHLLKMLAKHPMA